MFDKLKKATEVVGNFHLFKDGIKPMWEDEQNKNGGKWVFQKSILLDTPPERYQMFNVVWLKTVFPFLLFPPFFIFCSFFYVLFWC